jgi:hypothetical protein
MVVIADDRQPLRDLDVELPGGAVDAVGDRVREAEGGGRGLTFGEHVAGERGCLVELVR